MTTREQDIVATGCILNFSNDIYSAMDEVNNYIIFMDEIEASYPKPADTTTETKQIPQELQTQLKQSRVNVRYSIMRVQSQLQGISQVVKGFKTDEINKTYLLIKTAPERKDCETYINLVYTGLMNSVLKDLLANLQMDYSKLMKD